MASRRKRPGPMSLSGLKAAQNQTEYEQIFEEYNKLIMLNPDRYIIIHKYLEDIKCEEILGQGDKKTIFHCPKNQDDNIDIVYVIGRIDNDEILRHIKLLQIYYDNGGISLGFKIPNIYLKIKDNNIYYFMDYINIGSRTLKFAKTQLPENPDNQEEIRVFTNIGRLLGLYALQTNELFIEFEIYRDLQDDKYTLLDFGEVENLKNITNKITYSKPIYDGIHDTFIIEDLDNYIDINPIGSREEYEAHLDELRAKQKYIKYKKKYLELKKRLNNLHI